MLEKIKRHKWPALAGIGFTVFFAVSSKRYEVGPATSAAHCLYSSFFVIDKADEQLARNKLIAFKQTIHNDILPQANDQVWIKRLVGLPGDTISVELRKVTVTSASGESFEYPLDATQLIQAINYSISDITKTITLSDGEIFLIGETPGSFDSRFWGPQNIKNIIGTGYALF